MNVLIRKTFSITASSLIAALTIGSAVGQQVKVEGEKPAYEDLLSPDIPGTKKSFKAKDWLEIEAKLRISMDPAPESKTCDKLTVKWYVAVKNPEKAGTMFLLTKDVEHVNLPLGEDIYSSVYLSPASIKRLTGFDRAGKSSVELAGYEVLVNGVKVAAQTSKSVGGKTEWWLIASPKISRTDTVPLLNKSETPFSMMWWDRYAEVSAPGK
jgi:hypothetical protein